MNKTLGAMAMMLAPVAAASLAWAQTAPAPPPDSDAGRCATLVQTFDPILPFKTPPTVTASGPNSCTLGRTQLDLMPALGYEAEQVLVTGFTPQPGAPAPADGKIRRTVELRDVRQLTPRGPPGMNWMQRVSQTPLLVVFDSSEDAAVHAITMSLTVSGRYYGEVSLSLDLAGLGPDTEAFGTPRVQAASLHAVRLHWDSQLMLLRFAVPAVAARLGDHPEEEVAAQKRNAEKDMRDELGKFPNVAPGSMDALAAFINDFPRPTKVLDVAVDLSAHPLSAADAGVATDEPGAAEALAKQFKLTATYAGEAK